MYEEDVLNIAGLEEQLLGVDADQELEGLGRKLGVEMGPGQKKVARVFASSRNKPAVRPQLTRAQKQFLVEEKKLDDDSKRRIREGGLQFVDGDFYVRKQISGGGIQIILDPTTIQRAGVSKFDKNRLPDLVNMVLSRIKVGYGNTATSNTDPAVAVYSTSGAAVPAPLLNGEITVLIDEKPVYNGRIQKFFTDPANAVVPHAIEAHAAGLAVENPKLIKAQEGIKIQITIAEGQSLATTSSHFIEVVLMGPVTQPR